MTLARTGTLLVAMLAGFACKDKKADPPPAPAPTEPAPTTPAPTTPAPTPTPTPTPRPGVPGSGEPAIALGDGESFVAGDGSVVGANPMLWRPTPTEAVAVGFVTKGEAVRLVAATTHGATELATIEFNSAYSTLLGFVVAPDGGLVAVFESSGGSGDPGFLAAWRLTWDAAGKKVVVADKGNWAGTEAPGAIPAWAHLPDPK